MIKIPVSTILSVTNAIHAFTAKNKFMPDSIIFDETDPKNGMVKLIPEVKEELIKPAQHTVVENVWEEALKVFEPTKNTTESKPNVFEYLVKILTSDKYAVDKSKILHVANLRMIGLDALDTIALIMNIEDDFDIELTDAELGFKADYIDNCDEVVTIGNLVRIIESKVK